MKRRDFLSIAGGIALSPLAAWAAPEAIPRRLLVLVELKGGNDGLNTVVPYADPLYRQLRPRLGLDRDAVVKLTDAQGLHPSLSKLGPLWERQELAIVQGLGYPRPNLSHFRSIEIWDTASPADEYLATGWLARAFQRARVPASYAAEGVIVGARDMGPLTGAARAVSLTTPEQFLRNAQLAREGGEGRNPALAHLLQVEHEIVASAGKITAGIEFRTAFPSGPFGASVKTAAQLAANPSGIAAIRITLDGFDTHANQPARQAALLTQLGDGLAALREALVECGRWDDTVVATYAEFGRRPRQNESNGTDHGTVAPHFVMGGKVRGGVYGGAPQLDRLDGAGNLSHSVDFRAYYATFLERWWNIAPGPVVGTGHRALAFLA